MIVFVWLSVAEREKVREGRKRRTGVGKVSALRAKGYHGVKLFRTQSGLLGGMLEEVSSKHKRK